MATKASGVLWEGCVPISSRPGLWESAVAVSHVNIEELNIIYLLQRHLMLKRCKSCG